MALGGRGLARRIGVDRERVHVPVQLARQRCVDHAVALDPALPPEGLGHNIDPEMRLPARPVSGVTFMLVGFIDDTQARGRESLGQLFRDDLSGAHGLGLASAGAVGQSVRRASFYFVKLAGAPSASA